MKKNVMPAGRQGFAAILILIFIVAILAAGYFIIKSGLKLSVTLPTSTSATLPQASNPPGATPTSTTTSLFTGKLARINQDLGLFVETDDMKLNGRFGGFVYYSAGKFTSGSLNGYTRIIATSPAVGPGFTPIYILATKDFKTYVLDDPDNLIKLPSNDFQNPYTYLDKSKISSTLKFDTEQPKEISLDSKMSLYLDNLLTLEKDSSFKDKFNQSISETDIQTDSSNSQKLSSPVDNLTMYFQMNPDTKNKYILGDTKVIVIDPTGLPEVYSLTTSKGISDYKVNKSAYDAAIQQYNQEMDKYNQKLISTMPEYPTNFAYSPHLGFAGADIAGSSGVAFYKDYETAFPAECANDLDTKVVNVNDSDLQQVGMVGNIPVFSLKDINSDLNSLEYHSKMDDWANDTSNYFQTANPGITKPANVDDYSKDNPLLFIKDYWGRWIALGEWDIKLMGGCGKPVIYLYPQKDTEVTVKFNAPVSFTTDIPTYSGYWQVLAHTDGSLTNLRQNIMDCSNLDSSKPGSEYAKQACLTNTYPYLYWSGNIVSSDYLKIDKGWIVQKSDLQTFVDSKLSLMGLNYKERNDFESYWISEMDSKNSPYYRVSFLTTDQVNQIFPMTVEPMPDTVFRIFMDWQPLGQLPKSSLLPQDLPTLIRNGFTLVEWGGLKIP